MMVVMKAAKESGTNFETHNFESEGNRDESAPDPDHKERHEDGDQGATN